jgi:hypothetical protein
MVGGEGKRCGWRETRRNAGATAPAGSFGQIPRTLDGREPETGNPFRKRLPGLPDGSSFLRRDFRQAVPGGRARRQTAMS